MLPAASVQDLDFDVDNMILGSILTTNSVNIVKDNYAIQSGHFMISRLTEVEKEDEDDDEVSMFSQESNAFLSSTQEIGYNFVKAIKSTSQTYNFGSGNSSTLAIDASLTKLFQCMTLAYSGKITSPKWKSFRGMHLSIKDKVRLNNIIWREWHIQYIFQKLPVVCQFANPLSDYIHSKPEAVVLEGMYWKRRFQTVTKEYRKWRKYYHDRYVLLKSRACLFPCLVDNQATSGREHLEGEIDDYTSPYSNQQFQADFNLPSIDMIDMDFSDNFFSSLNQPFVFPSPRDLGQLSCADLIQPSLVQMQPTLDDFMDVDSIHELLAGTNSGSSNAGVVVTFGSATLGPSFEVNSLDAEQVDICPHTSAMPNFLTPLDSSTFPSCDNFAGINMLSALAALTYAPNDDPLPNPEHLPDMGSTSLLSTLPSFSLLSNSPCGVREFGLPSARTSSPSNAASDMSTAINPAECHHSSLLGALLASGPACGKVAPFPVSLVKPDRSMIAGGRQSSVCTAANNASDSAHLTGGIKRSCRKLLSNFGVTQLETTCSGSVTESGSCSASTSSSYCFKPPAIRKDVLLSKGIKQAPVRKHQPIAPAPATTVSPSPSYITPCCSSSTQHTFLAQLLTKGTYPGALSSLRTTRQITPCLSAPPLTTSANTFPTTYARILPAVSSASLWPSLPTFKSQAVVMTVSPLVSVSGLTVLTSTEPRLLQSKKTYITTGRSDMLQATIGSMPSPPALGISDVSCFHPSSILTVSSDQGFSLVSSPSQLHGLKPSGQVDFLASFNDIISSNQSASVTNNLTASTMTTVSCSLSSSSLFLSSVINANPLLVRTSPTTRISSTKDSEMGCSTLSCLDSQAGSMPVRMHMEQRKGVHLSAEQRRRFNLKSGFELLNNLVPSLTLKSKVSKATTLQKTAEFCRKLKHERSKMQNEACILQQEIEYLSNAIQLAQSQLPETGVPVGRPTVPSMNRMLDDYIRTRTAHNWKFWIFSNLLRSLFESYNSTVCVTSVNDLCSSLASWLDQHCSLSSLRPAILTALRHMSMTTSVLTDPQQLEEHAKVAVMKGVGKVWPTRVVNDPEADTSGHQP